MTLYKKSWLDRFVACFSGNILMLNHIIAGMKQCAMDGKHKFITVLVRNGKIRFQLLQAVFSGFKFVSHLKNNPFK